MQRNDVYGNILFLAVEFIRERNKPQQPIWNDPKKTRDNFSNEHITLNPKLNWGNVNQ